MALGYGNQFALRARAHCGCRTRRTEEADRHEAAAPNPSRGSQPIDDLGSHHQAWEPSGPRGDAVDLSTGRLPRGAISTGWMWSDE